MVTTQGRQPRRIRSQSTINHKHPQADSPTRDSSPSVPSEPIAIVGIGCRFPGADGPAAFWQVLRDGVDAIGEVPPDRFDIDAYYDPRVGTPGKIATRCGGFVSNIDQFDATFFGISPREATEMDPQQRLLLEVAWEALEDGGQIPAELPVHETGVYIGAISSEYEDLVFGDPTQVNVYTLVGNSRSVLAGRLSYALGLQGPSVTVDTACSSSLAAIHLACQSLRSGECRVALAGGVNLILEPKYSLGFSRAGMLAPDGRCKSFDARADGFVRSDGVAVVVLKPLSAARADGDPVYALIRGSAVNNDGRSGGLLMTPSQSGQEAVIRAAYRNAGVSPAQVHYVEAHGTGTSVGDPVEAQALGTVLAEGRPQGQCCAIGSVKSNIGHTEGAAGVAGVIKVALALKHGLIPPSLHCHEPNPAIPWNALALRVQQELAPWPRTGAPALAAVSSFGISGTNAHLILEEAPAVDHARSAHAWGAGAMGGEPRLLPLSAQTPDALHALAGSYLSWLDAGDETSERLEALCTTASTRRAHHDYRLAICMRTKQELADALRAALTGEAHPGLSSGMRIADGSSKVVFVFPGQGGQWLGMARQLLAREPSFRAKLEACDAAMRHFVAWSLIEQLSADVATSHLDEIDVLQPAIFALQVSLAALWEAWGITPDAVIGHSMGEVAAAHVAGALTLEDASRIICLRSALLRRTSGRGSMALVHLSADEAAAALVGYEQRVVVAALNGPTLTILSGAPDALAEVTAALERRNVFCRLVRVDVASHSPQMDPLRPELLRLLADVRPRRARIPIYSTVSAMVSDGLDLDAPYWERNLRQPVLFLPALQQLLDSGHDTFVELSPHPTLTVAVQQTGDHAGRDATVLPSLRRDEHERGVLLESLGALYTVGCPINWHAVVETAAPYISLPSYPWQHERFWLNERGVSPGGSWVRNATSSRRSGAGSHPLLGDQAESAAHPGTYTWEVELGIDHAPYLTDHRVEGKAVLPAAASIELAHAGAAQMLGHTHYTLERVAFKKALFLPEHGGQRVQLVIAPSMPGMHTFRLYSRQAEDGEQSTAWTLHADGVLRDGHNDAVSSPHPEADEAAKAPTAEADSLVAHGNPDADSWIEMVQARCQDVLAADDYYSGLRDQGLQYGPAFQGITHLWRRDGEALARLHLPEQIAAETAAYSVHPALLDACFQTIAATLPDDVRQLASTGIFLPVGVAQFRVVQSLTNFEAEPPTLWCQATLQQQPDDRRERGDTFTGDITLMDDTGAVLVQVLGLSIQQIGSMSGRSAAAQIDEWLYEIQWQLSPAAPSTSAKPTAGSWLLFADQGGVGKRLQALLEAHGAPCILAMPGQAYAAIAPRVYVIDPDQPADYRQLLSDAVGPDALPCHGVIHLWSTNAPPPESTVLASLGAAQALGAGSVLSLVQALASTGWAPSPRLWLVTTNAQPAPSSTASTTAATTPLAIAQAPLIGLGRVLAYEHPELRCTRVDLSAVPTSEEIQALAQAVWSDDQEAELALRGTSRYVARLVRATPARPPESEGSAAQHEVVAATGDTPFHAVLATPGILDHIELRATGRPAMGREDIEVRVHAAGLNFPEVLMAMGLYPGQRAGPLTLGIECAGTVTAVGAGVETFHVGDAVMTIAEGAFGRFVTTPAAFALPKPSRWTFEQAATVPIAYATAFYALHTLGRLRPGERVLIHSAATGVGLAAVHLALDMGAEVFATAGTPDKRGFLQAMGIAHVFDSRTLDFAEAVWTHTGGRGMDVVVNSLAGAGLITSLSLLAPGGRFVELGKRDIYADHQIGLDFFKLNRAFYAVDLDELAHTRPEALGNLLAAVGQRLTAHEGSIRPLPVTLFPLTEIVDAFRAMTQGHHVGKIVLTLPPAGETFALSPSAAASKTLATAGLISSEGTYLITGGLGGLGLTVAQWLVKQGARTLVLTGRSGASAAAQPVLDLMRQTGATVVVAQADVAREQDVRDVLSLISTSLPPLRGVMHAAGVLDDGIVLQLDQRRLRTVMAPKMLGAWNLHSLTADVPVDWFVLFSSAASMIGSPGQGNYAAANAFLDALAHHRRALGLPALTINWGPWAEVGLAVRPDRGERLAQRGMRSFSPREGLEALARLLEKQAAQVGVMPFALRQWARFYPMARGFPLFAELAREQDESADTDRAAGDHSPPLRSVILAAAPGDRLGLLETALHEQVAKVLRLARTKLDMHRPLTMLGLDSLMAVELKNWIEANLQVTVPVTDLLQGPSVVGLTAQVFETLDQSLPTIPASPPGVAPALRLEGAAAHAVQLSAHLPLSYGQRALWFLAQLAPESAAYNVPSALHLRGLVHVAALRSAFQTLVERHPALRTTFAIREGEPVQEVHESMPVAFVEVDATVWSTAELEEALREEAHRPFDLAHGPLLRVCLFRRAADEYVLALTVHHIAVDFASLLLLTQELRVLYSAAATGQPASLAPTRETGYGEYIRWQQDLLAGPRGDELRTYWLRQLEGAPVVLDLPTDRPRPPVQTYHGRTHPFVLPSSLTQHIRNLARAEGTTLYAILLASFQTLLARATGQEDLLVGSPVAGRSRADFEDVVGYFVNPVVLRADISGDPTFRVLLGRTRATLLAALEHQDYPFALLVEHLRLAHDPSRSPVFQALFALENSPRYQDLSQLVLGASGARVAWEDLDLDAMSVDWHAAQFDLTLTVIDGGQTLSAALEGNSDLFAASTLARMAAQFQTLLETVVDDPDQPVWRLSLLPADEREQLIGRWSMSPSLAITPIDACLHELVEAQVTRTPDTIAVVSGTQHLTYAELNQRANQLAHYLRSQGIGPDSLVGICVERSLELAVGVLGILKAGGAYLPMDPALPPRRLGFLLADAQARVLLTQERLVERLGDYTGQVIRLDADRRQVERRSIRNPRQLARPSDLAYVVYTSGSTGQPKGVEITHRSICHRLLWAQDADPLVADDAMLQHTSFGFDVAVLELFRPLLAGARVVFAPAAQVQDSAELVHLIAHRRITHLDVVPSQLVLLLDEPELAACSALRQVSCGGEPLTTAIMGRFFTRLGAERVALYNRYGPTEATIDVTWHRCLPGDQETTVPIGRPIADVQLYVLDSHLQPVPIGMPGELAIGDVRGVVLARGYHGRPELTAERFLPHPFDATPNARIYRTGDWVRFRHDGALEFLGRHDDQIKLHGYRIELGEIAAVLAAHPGVRESVVVLRHDGSGEPRLVAYVVAQPHSASSSTLAGWLRQQLPSYMVPAAIVPLDALPRQTNGKADVARLPVPDWSRRPQDNTTFIPPRTPLEEEIGGVWAAVLNIQQVGVHDSFFECGGTSLQAAQLVFQVRSKFQVDLPLRGFIAAPTVAGLAKAITRARALNEPTSMTDSASHEVAADAEDMEVPDLEAEAVLDSSAVPHLLPHKLEAGEPRHLLLTGATGFLGTFLLAELLQQTAATIHCLVRARDEEEGSARLRDRLQAYGVWEDRFGDRLVPVLGDLAQPRLGLSPVEFTRLAGEIEQIYHNGALVNFVYPYRTLRAPNVAGTKEILRLASQGRVKVVHYVSTLSVFSQAGATDAGQFGEDEPPDRHGTGLRIGYAQSKWVAEQLVVAARSRGLPVVIYRPGTITGHSKTGAWNTDEFLCRAIKGSIQLGSMPATDDELDMTPVDYVAAAIVTISRQSSAVGSAFHLINPATIRLRELVEYLRARGYRLRPVTFDAWRQELLAAATPADNVLYPLLPLVSDGELEEQLRISPARYECRNTVQSLSGTAVSCPVVDAKLLDVYLSWWEHNGFLELPHLTTAERYSR